MCENPNCSVSVCRWQRNRAANLRLLIGRYVRAGHADAAYECTVNLVRLMLTGEED
jgi:hypothetical protein